MTNTFKTILAAAGLSLAAIPATAETVGFGDDTLPLLGIEAPALTQPVNRDAASRPAQAPLDRAAETPAQKVEERRAVGDIYVGWR